MEAEMATLRRYELFTIILALALSGSRPVEAEIRIGFAGPLSGPYAASGHRHRVAVETAIYALNREGGVLDEQIELVVADDRCGLGQAMAAARRLVEAQVSLVVGHLCSHSSLLAAGIYETADVLMISPTSTHPRLTEEGRANVFRLTGRNDREGQMAAELLTEIYADLRLAILHDGSTYGEGLAREAQAQLHRRGMEEALFEIYTPGASDYSGLVAELRQAEIDVVYVGGYGPDAGLILRTARTQGDDLQMIGGVGLSMDEFWTVAGTAAEGTIFTTRRDVRSTPAAAAVLKEFRKRGLGTRPGGIGAYVAVQVWAMAVERAGTVDLPAVARVLRRSRFTTPLGRIAFDDKGDVRDDVWEWHVWQDGNYAPLPQEKTRFGYAYDLGLTWPARRQATSEQPGR
jgi:branched-chain amino acid transport system substrate-binding protein